MDIIYVKGMVCIRCIKTVQSIVSDMGCADAIVKLGYIENANNLEFIELDKKLQEEGFVRLISNSEIISEEVKLVLINLISNDLLSELNVNISDYISSKVELSYPQIAAHFKKTFGRSIDNYWQALRIEKAKEWLSYEDYTVTEIALKVGYNSLQSFSKAFKSAVGISPLTYRNNKPKTREPLNDL